MHIGLLRHFKVNHPYPAKFLVTYPELVKWFEDYEQAEIAVVDFDNGAIVWDRCISSSSPRALHTARHIFRGEVESTDRLKELDLVSALSTRIPLPFLVWAILAKVKSMTSHQVMMEFNERISSLADELIQHHEGNILVVSHAFVIQKLRRELLRRGYEGPEIKMPEYGVVYIFSKT